MNIKTKTAICALVVSIFSGCGGGGGGGSPAVSNHAVSTLDFPLISGVKALIANGLSRTFAVTGTCTGIGTKTSAPATTGAVFENVSGFSSVSTLTATLSAPCTSIAQTTTSYVDTNYIPLGFNSIGVNYGVYLTAPTYPTTVKVGMTGTIGIENLYTNSTKAVSNGSVASSYVVTSESADTASTATINIIAKIYDASSNLTATEQDFYRISSTGALTPLYIDLQYTSGQHYVFTYN